MNVAPFADAGIAGYKGHQRATDLLLGLKCNLSTGGELFAVLLTVPAEELQSFCATLQKALPQR